MRTLPARVRTDASNAFAHHTMHTRVPAILRETQAQNADYAPPIHSAIDRLHDEIVSNAPIRMLEFTASDYDDWSAMCSRYAGDTWLNSDWFYVEPYAYRRLIEAVRWFETGRDPFAPKKLGELSSAALWQTLDEALATRAYGMEERLGALIEFGVWGNRIDLSYALVAAHHGTQASAEDLLVDHLDHAVTHLLRTTGDVHFVLDNSGTELAMDCALADALLERGHRVIFHAKAHPFFVSDTTVPDVQEFLRRLDRGGGEAQSMAGRLRAAFERSQWRWIPDFFWSSAYFLSEMPPRLRTAFSGAQMVILKGDLNYRRALGDALWEPTTSFAEVLAHMPAPVLSLRTMKSDTIVGLRPGQAEALDQIDAKWRNNGKRGIIQSSLG